MKITVTLDTNTRGKIEFTRELPADLAGHSEAALLAATYFDEIGPLLLGALGVTVIQNDEPALLETPTGDEIADLAEELAAKPGSEED